MTLHFEVASSNSFRDFPKISCWNSEVAVCSGGVNVICSQLDVYDDVTYGQMNKPSHITFV